MGQGCGCEGCGNHLLISLGAVDPVLTVGMKSQVRKWQGRAQDKGVELWGGSLCLMLLC